MRGMGKHIKEQQILGEQLSSGAVQRLDDTELPKYCVTVGKNRMFVSVAEGFCSCAWYRRFTGICMHIYYILHVILLGQWNCVTCLMAYGR